MSREHAKSGSTRETSSGQRNDSNLSLIAVSGAHWSRYLAHSISVGISSLGRDLRLCATEPSAPCTYVRIQRQFIATRPRQIIRTFTAIGHPLLRAALPGCIPD